MKHNKYDNHAKTIECKFLALVVDAFGSLHKEFHDLLLRIEGHAQRCVLDFTNPHDA